MLIFNCQTNNRYIKWKKFSADVAKSKNKFPIPTCLMLQHPICVWNSKTANFEGTDEIFPHVIHSLYQNLLQLIPNRLLRPSALSSQQSSPLCTNLSFFVPIGLTSYLTPCDRHNQCLDHNLLNCLIWQEPEPSEVLLFSQQEHHAGGEFVEENNIWAWPYV